MLAVAISSSSTLEVLIYPPLAVATYLCLLGHSRCMLPTPWKWWHLMSREREVEGEDEVIFGAAGAVVVFVGVEEVKAHVVVSRNSGHT
jgi:hypothetical protein